MSEFKVNEYITYKEIEKNDLEKFFIFITEFKDLIIRADYHELKEFTINLNSISNLLNNIYEKPNRARLIEHCKEFQLNFERELRWHKNKRFIKSKLITRLQKDDIVKQLPYKIFSSTNNLNTKIKDIIQYFKLFKELFYFLEGVVFNWVDNPGPAGINIKRDIDYIIEFLFPKIRIQNGVVFLSNKNTEDSFFDDLNKMNFTFKSVN